MKRYDTKPATWLSIAGGLSGLFLALLLAYVVSGLFGGKSQ